MQFVASTARGGETVKKEKAPKRILPLILAFVVLM
jgi:hypothetical protein